MAVAALRDLPPVAFEFEPGAASLPLPGGYRRREPEKTALHAVVRENLETLLDEARGRSESGYGYPAFVEKEFRRYLDCGLLAHGFARLRCPTCGFERLVAFSCKGRVCPSCWARRTAETAADLVDRVLPEGRYRQWVLTFPWGLRFLLAVEPNFLSEMLAAFLRTVFAWQRLQGRRLGVRGETGSVTFTQRFGGILNLNQHFHCIVPDGLFVPVDGDTVEFAPLPPPTDADIVGLTERLARRLEEIARRRLDRDDGSEPDPDQRMVRAAAAEALRIPLARVERSDDGHVGFDERKPLCARVDGFSLHAARTVAPHDRQGLERLCRYGLRAPFSQDRLSTTSDGRVRLRLLRPWPNAAGRTEILLAPQAFLSRMAALVPAPYQNLVRYHGVFANRSHLRPFLPKPPARIVLAPTFAPPVPTTGAGTRGDGLDVNGTQRAHRLSRAALLRCVLDIEALSCPGCGTAMVVLAFLTDPRVVRRILDHLDLPAAAPRPSSARPNDEDRWLPLDHAHRQAQTVTRTAPSMARGLPPRAPP